jgi:hypothetical protein
MRRSPRTLLMALLPAVLALAAAGCGGSEIAADEVPGPPPALSVPTDKDLGGGGGDGGAGTDDTSGSGGQDGDADTADEDAGGTAPEATAEPDASGGAAAPETQTPPDDTATNDTAPPADSEAEQFETFCEQNAGAC